MSLMGAGIPFYRNRRPASVMELSVFPEYPVERGFRGYVDAFFQKIVHYLSRGCAGVFGAVRNFKDLPLFLRRELLRCFSGGMGSLVLLYVSLFAPSLEGSFGYADFSAGFCLGGTARYGFSDQFSCFTAIRGTDQSSSFSPQIAWTFFLSTSRAAASARAFSLRRSSCSSFFWFFFT